MLPIRFAWSGGEHTTAETGRIKREINVDIKCSLFSNLLPALGCRSALFFVAMIGPLFDVTRMEWRVSCRLFYVRQREDIADDVRSIVISKADKNGDENK